MRASSNNYVAKAKIAGTGSRYYIRTVPADVRNQIGRAKWKISLGAVDERTAQSKARKLAEEHDAQIAAARAPAPIDTIPADDKARILEAGGIGAFVEGLDQRAREVERLRTEAELLNESALDLPIDLGGGFTVCTPSPPDDTPEINWTRAKLAGMNAERAAIEGEIAREAPLLRQLRIPDAELTRTHATLAGVLATVPHDPDQITLSGALNQWEAKKSPQAPEQFRWPVKLFEQHFGPLPLKQISKPHIREFRDLLETLPKAAGKANAGVTLAELRQRSAKGAPRISRATAAKHLRAVGTILRFAVSEGYLENSPAEGIRYHTSRSQIFDDATVEARRSLTPAETRAVLDAADAYEGTGDPSDVDTAWFARLAIYTGARAEELSQIAPADIAIGGAIPHIRVHAEGEKKLKNTSSIRIVPIHARLLEMGFAAFVKARANGALLFSTLKADGRDRLYSRMQRRLTRLMRGEGKSATSGNRKKIAGANIADKRVVPHSFRHTLKSAARLAQVPEEIAERLMGHTSPERKVARGYGDVPLVILSEWMNKIDPLDSRREVAMFGPNDN